MSQKNNIQTILKNSLSSKDILVKYDITPRELLEEYENFCLYWTEKSPNGKKERWEMEKIFDPSRRFHRWLKNNKKWNKKTNNGYNGEAIETDEF